MIEAVETYILIKKRIIVKINMPRNVGEIKKLIKMYEVTLYK